MEKLFTAGRLESFVEFDHPRRPIREMANKVLWRLDSLLAGCMRTASVVAGRASRRRRCCEAMPIQVFHRIRSECQLMEQVHYNLLYR